MPEISSSPRRGASPRTVRNRGLELSCPICGKGVRVPAARLVEGTPVRCPHCSGEPEVTREFDETNGRRRWVLADPRPAPEEERA